MKGWLLTGNIFRGAGATDAIAKAGRSSGGGAHVAFSNLLDAGVLCVCKELLVKIDR